MTNGNEIRERIIEFIKAILSKAFAMESFFTTTRITSNFRVHSGIKISAIERNILNFPYSFGL